MRCLIFSDAHYDLGSARNTHDIFSNAIDELVLAAAKYKADMIVGLGDLLNRKNMPTDLVKSFGQVVRKIPEKYAVVIVGGNHEFTPEGNSILDLVKWRKNVTLITKNPYIVPCKKCSLYFVPWTMNLKDNIEFYTSRKNCVLLSHLLLDGSQARVTFSSDYTLKTFKGYKRVFLGDVHKRQKFGKVVYCGNFIQTTYSDFGFKQGFIIYDTDTDQYQYVNLKVPELEVRESEGESKIELEANLTNILESKLPAAATLSMDEAVEVLDGALKVQFPKRSKSTGFYIKELKVQLC